ncbi:PglY protein [Pseudonocardia sp.]|uniref:PglY protein n=1 Tax=Pseudonocardia sp. TaxID=60912 RepID=UPI0026389038|nr:PglY protein [Pseudonocardia sp.]
MTTGAPLLRELIRIPERIHQGDFVLRLTEGVEHARDTLDSYVITPQLRVAFDEALGLIGSALVEGRSKASYLHGSFGSGKSHFMAVLHALLRGETSARSRPELADALAAHPWLGERRFMLVPYHLIGAESLEAAVLGGYVSHVRRHHPDAPLPRVYRAQGLLADTRALRDSLGAEAFLARLPAGGDENGGDDGDWGDVATGWTAAEVDSALDGPPDSGLARRLVADAVPVFMPSYVDSVAGAANAFVPLDQGLSAISEHARDLGNDGLVLFLDELVLWLAGKIGDPAFVARETEKVAKLVESSDARRAVPIVSFVARQRDLRELMGARRTGAETLSFQDQLSYWDGRFFTVTLEDRNLGLIAEKRILAPVDDAARDLLATAFRRTDALPGATRDILLTDGDGEAFRRTYPFSPAFMQTLVHVSSALQRERTALKLMQQILVDRRDDLRLGELVPLGDLFDAIADGNDQPFTEKLKHEFDKARTLYRRTLRPMLLTQRELTEEQIEAGDGGPRLVAFRSDDRLVKTLLLAALAPEVPAMGGMTARRLAALNHGSVRTPIPGQEIAEVSRRLRSWAGQVAELTVGGEDDPSVTLELVSVDLGQILERVTHVDNDAARRRLFRELLLGALGVTDDGAFEIGHPVVWRGSKRAVEIVYGNVRDRAELRDEVFTPAQDGRWRLVLDFPFDADTYSAAEDRNRLSELREQHARRCVAWLPAFVTGTVLAKVGTLVRIEHLLVGNRLDENATHLGAEDRQRARDLLRNQGDALRAELREVLRQAYGLAQPDPARVLEWSDHLISLDPALTPRLDVGRSFPDALTHLVDQCFAASYPEHPQLDPARRGTAVTAAELRTVLAVVRRAAEADGGRVETDRSERAALQRLAHPLQLGELHGGPFLLSRHWEAEFERRAARDGGSELPVRRVRGWLADLGLETGVENLVIATYAELSRRAWVRAGQQVPPPATLDEVRDDMVLRPLTLPDPAAWAVAVERAGLLFGVAVPERVISPRSVAQFAAVSDAARLLRSPAAELVTLLEQYLPRLGVPLPPDQDRPDQARPEPARLALAGAADRLLTELRGAEDPSGIVTVLAQAPIEHPLVSLGRTLSTAGAVAETLRGADWQVLDRLRDLARPGAAPLRETLAAGASAGEDAAPLHTVLAAARTGTLNLIAADDREDHAARDREREAAQERRDRETETRLATEQAERERRDRERRELERQELRREAEQRERERAAEERRRRAAEESLAAEREAREQEARELRPDPARTVSGGRDEVLAALRDRLPADAQVEVVFRVLGTGG